MSEEPTSQKIELTFRKGEAARFLSHLDLMATFEYAVRRAKLPVELSAGFNPRQRLSVAAPLRRRLHRRERLLEVTLREPMDADEVSRRLQNALPAGIEMLHARIAPAGLKTAASRLVGGVSRGTRPAGGSRLDERVTRFLQSEKVEIEEERGTERCGRVTFVPSLQTSVPQAKALSS